MRDERKTEWKRPITVPLGASLLSVSPLYIASTVAAAAGEQGVRYSSTTFQPQRSNGFYSVCRTTSVRLSRHQSRTFFCFPWTTCACARLDSLRYGFFPLCRRRRVFGLDGRKKAVISQPKKPQGLMQQFCADPLTIEMKRRWKKWLKRG